MSPTSNTTGLRGQQGFTFVEMVVVLVMVGLMSWASFSAYETVNDQRSRSQAQAMAREMQSQLRTFSIRQGRLPCPDSNTVGTGYEGLVGGVCSAGNQLGWFPYVSLGMVLPAEALRARYAVFRAANGAAVSDADLAVIKERTGDPISHVNYQDVTDLMKALINANGLTLNSSHAFLTGDEAAGGPINCTTNQVMNVAYWLVIPLEDRNGNNSRLDSPHETGSLCANSPSSPIRADNDDVVFSESPAQLAGWLRKSLP